MSDNFIQWNVGRTVAMAAFRARNRLRRDAGGPRVFLNSVPKAGTHLLMTELEQLGGIRRSMLHVPTRKVNKLADEDEHLDRFEFDDDAFAGYLGTVKGGQYFTGHLPWSESISRLLAERDVKTLFMLRDPRAVLVSYYFYVMGLKRHYLHKLFAQLPDDDARYAVLIDGRSVAPRVMPMRVRIESFSGWSRDEAVLSLKFEDLVGASGGGTADAKAAALETLQKFLGLDDADVSSQASAGVKRTATLREGKSEAWRASIPAAALDHFNTTCGDLLADQGYRR